MMDTSIAELTPAKQSKVAPLRTRQYRQDIDGLRAIAIVSVILYHFGLSCSGGFVGVDIFFVISGYLITRHIEKDLLQHSFSIVSFYHRRIRRIFPALFVVLTVSAIVGLLVLPPDELLSFGKSLAASSIFGSNILFNRSESYFTSGSALRPLLHTWSLSVEEQFYIFWPLILAAVHLRPLARLKMPLLTILGVASLLLSAYWVGQVSTAAFYLIPSRMWELMIGALLSMPQITGSLQRLPRALCEMLSAVGIALLGLAIFTYTSATPFPGFAALLPCLGAGCIIAAGEYRETVAGSLLSARPVVWIGLISYSLYLWHWPLLVYARIILNHDLSTLERLTLLPISVALAWLTLKLVETPTRNPRIVHIDKRGWLMTGLVASLLFLAVGLTFWLFKGFPSRATPPGQPVLAAIQQFKALENSPCLAFTGTVPSAKDCTVGAITSAAAPSVILWGDSHAAMLSPVIAQLGSQLGFSSRLIAKAGCAPIIGVNVLPANQTQLQCRSFNDQALKIITQDKTAPLVLYAASWDRYVDGRFLVTTSNSRPSLAGSRRQFVQSVSQTLSTLIDSGHRVVLISQTPTPSDSPVECIARAEFNHQNQSVCATMPVADHRKEEEAINSILNEALSKTAADHHWSSWQSYIAVIHPFDALCSNQSCSLIANGNLLYLDDNHLTMAGTFRVGHLLQPVLAQMLAASIKIPANERNPNRR